MDAVALDKLDKVPARNAACHARNDRPSFTASLYVSARMLKNGKG